MPFSLPRGETLTPIVATNPGAFQEAVEQVGNLGGTILTDLPVEMQYSPGEDPRDWAARTSGLLAPVIEAVRPGLLPSDYRLEGRNQIHHQGDHLTVHQDPRYRDPIFFGYTGGDTEAEFRFATHLDGPSFNFSAGPGTLWVMGGPSLITPERAGGKGGTWHEVAPPNGNDRHVAIGSFRRPRNN